MCLQAASTVRWHALNAAPLRHPSARQLELDLAAPGLLQRAAAWVPGLAQQLSLASAWQRLATGLLDDVAAFVAALVVYHQLPLLLGAEPVAAAAAAA